MTTTGTRANRTDLLLDGQVAKSKALQWSLFLSAVALLLLAPWLIQVEGVGNKLLLVALIVVTLTGVGQSVGNGLRPTRLVWFVFNFSWLVVGATYQLSHQVFAWNDIALTGRQNELQDALLICLGANAAFLAGGVGASRSPEGFLQQSVVPRVKVGWCFLAACLAVTPFAASVNGGIANLFTSRSARNTAREAAGVSIDTSGGPLLALATYLPAALAFVSLLIFLIAYQKKGELEIPYIRTGIAAAAVLTIIYANPLTSSRFLSFSILGAVLLVIFRPRSKRAARRFLTILLVGLLAIYPLGNAFRTGFASDTPANSAELELGFEAFASKDFDGFQQVASSVIYVQDQGYQYGHHIGSALLYFVPRSIWEGKAQPASIDVAENRQYIFANLSLPLFAEFFIDLGPVLMLLVVGLYGRLCSILDRSWVLGSRTTRAEVLVPYMCLAQLGVMRGPLGSLVPLYGTVIILLLIGFRTSRSSSRPIAFESVAPPMESASQRLTL